MPLLKAFSVLFLCSGLLGAQQAPAGKPVEQAKSVLSAIDEGKPRVADPTVLIPGFDIDALDRSVDPCVDFYKFACGNWVAQNPIPADQSVWGRFNELAERTRLLLRDIVEKASQPHLNRSPVEQKIGDFYASCMDVSAIDKLGTKPIQPELDRIATIRTRDDVIETIAYLNLRGVRAVFVFYPHADLHDATMTIANIDQGGLSLPDRDYYLKTDPKSVETREKFAAHVQKMFELLGDKPKAAADEAKTVMHLETELAKASMDRTARRNVESRDHKMSVAKLSALAPNFDFPRYFTAVAAPEFTSLNVGNPGFFKAISGTFDSVPVADWKSYLRLHLLRATAGVLDTPFVQEEFEFERKYLAGVRELEPRWKRCLEYTDHELGEALGQLYVERAFGADAKQRTREMAEAIFAAMSQDIDSLTWMSDATKKAAHEKLAKVVDNIGYPDKWRDYSTVNILRGDAMGNLYRTSAFEFLRQVNKIGQPVDPTEWLASPPTVDAYYNPSRNDINFPAGILQPPFYDNRLDDPVNFGAIGAIIGHELTHGFDDQGAKFDPTGNFRMWWTKEDFAEFEKRGRCLVDEYSGFVAIEDVHLNGELTLGENTADNGGLRLSYMALESRLKHRSSAATAKIDGFTPEQRFFLGFGQIWCQNVTPESARLRAITDSHSPGQYRVDGVLVNMPEFQQAYGCKAGQPMVSANRCRTW